VLLRGAERHTPASWARLLAGVDAGDCGGAVAQVWIALQDLRHVYGAVSTDQARHRLHRFYWRCATAEVPELTRVARAISAWQDELLAYFTTGGASNGPTEAVNLLIKRIKRVGFGLRNFANYRLRLPLHCRITWHDAPTTRIPRTQATFHVVEPKTQCRYRRRTSVVTATGHAVGAHHRGNPR